MRVQSFLVLAATPFCLAGLASPLLAQGSIVIPPGTAAVDGNSADVEPFGYDQVRHVQYVHQSMLVGLAPNTLIKELAYRRDGNVTNPAICVRYRTIAT